jgi:2-iminobutanoate/2-iminopropanoate deaminase
MRRSPVIPEDGPPPSGTYTPGIRVGRLLFVSGQAPLGNDGDPIGGPVADQVRRALENVERVARAAGGTLAEAVRMGVYLDDLSDFAEMDAEYRTFFAGVPPARTTIQSNLREFAVEIDAVILLPEED